MSKSGYWLVINLYASDLAITLDQIQRGAEFHFHDGCPNQLSKF